MSIDFEQLAPQQIDVSAKLDLDVETLMCAVPERMAFKISEVSNYTGVKTHVLRYWENELSVLKPQKSKSNQRYYLRSDIAKIFAIKILMNEGFSLSGVKKAFDKWQGFIKTPDAIEARKNHLENKQTKDEIKSIINSITLKLNEIDYL